MSKPSKFCKLGTVSRGEIPYISDKIPRFNHSGCLLINNIREILLIKYQLTSFKVIDTSIAQARNGNEQLQASELQGLEGNLHMSGEKCHG